MESKAHYALIGTFVLLSLVAAVAFIAWLSNSQFDQQFDEYEVVFTGAVRGLSQGSEVRFNGLRVGEVSGLRLDSVNSNSVIADIQVNSNTPVDSKSYARLEPLGLTGLNYIQIFAGGEEYPLLKDMPGNKGPYRLEGQMSQFDSFLDEGGTVIEATQSALNRINATFSEDAIKDFQQILSNVKDLSGNLKNADFDENILQEMFTSIKDAADAVLGSTVEFDTAAKDFNLLVNNDLKSVLSRAEVTLAEVDKTLAEYMELADGATEVTVDARDAINRLSNSGVADLEETTDQLRQLITTLNRVADNLEQSPVQFLVGEEREKVELPQ